MSLVDSMQPLNLYIPSARYNERRILARKQPKNVSQVVHEHIAQAAAAQRGPDQTPS